MMKIFGKEQISNVCQTCVENKEVTPPVFFSDEFKNWCSDTGLCSKCGKVGDVFDFALLQIYSEFDLSPKFINANLSRLRQSRPNKPEPPLTLAYIRIIAERAQIYVKNCEQVKQKLHQQEPLAKEELEFILSVIDDNSGTWIVLKIDQTICDKLKVGQSLSEDEFHKMKTIFEYGIRNWQRPASEGKRA